eukprot:scaffold14384_cov86-Skeletonema_dohrnii-CCMP3373.AAC.3
MSSDLLLCSSAMDCSCDQCDTQFQAKGLQLVSSCYRASGLVVKSNVAIVGPRVRFSAGALRYDVGGYHSRLSRGIPGFESQYRNYSFCSPAQAAK